MAVNWSVKEVEAAVTDYFSILELELKGIHFNKTEHRRNLIEELSGRSNGSVELKRQNISAVLIDMGLPYIDGYKPRFNYLKSLLPEVVSERLKTSPVLMKLIERDTETVPEIPSVENILAALESAPASSRNSQPSVNESKSYYNPTGQDYLEREALNQKLGEAEEQFVVNFERARLVHGGNERLADRIEQISRTQGPAAGFDILSFEEDARERFIEVKTTKYGKETPSFLTPNELRVSSRPSSPLGLREIFRDDRWLASHLPEAPSPARTSLVLLPLEMAVLIKKWGLSPGQDTSTKFKRFKTAGQRWSTQSGVVPH